MQYLVIHDNPPHVAVTVRVCEKGDVRAIRDLFHRGSVPELEWTNPRTGFTPLTIAVEKGHLGAVCFLLIKGADADVMYVLSSFNFIIFRCNMAVNER